MIIIIDNNHALLLAIVKLNSMLCPRDWQPCRCKPDLLIHPPERNKVLFQLQSLCCFAICVCNLWSWTCPSGHLWSQKKNFKCEACTVHQSPGMEILDSTACNVGLFQLHFTLSFNSLLLDAHLTLPYSLLFSWLDKYDIEHAMKRFHLAANSV